MRIGFLGLGTMGAPLANNLRKAGFSVTVWNRSPDKAEPLVKKGVALAKTPRECAAGRDLVFTCLSDEEALEAVVEGPEGVFAGLTAGDTLVDASTCGTRETASLRERATARGAAFLSAPLLGSSHAAERAQLIVVAGGPPETRERARPALHAISAKLIELDDAVHAALMKLCVNSVGGAMLVGLAEALALGASGGLPLAKVVETLQSSPFHSPLFLMKGEQIVERDYAPRFNLELAEKDERLAHEAAVAQNARTPLGEAVRKVLADAIAAGYGEEDNAKVAELYLDWAGVKRK